MTPLTQWLSLLPPALRNEVIEDVSRKADKQSVLARKQQRLIGILKEHTNQGKRPEPNGANTCTAHDVQVGKPSRRTNTTEKVARIYGEGEKAVRERVYALEKAEAEPDKYGKFLKEMDDAGNPHGAYKRLREKRSVPNSYAVIIRPIRGNLSPGLGSLAPRPPSADVRRRHRRGRCEAAFVGRRAALDGHRSAVGRGLRRGMAGKRGRRRVPRSVVNDDRADWREAFALFPGDGGLRLSREPSWRRGHCRP